MSEHQVSEPAPRLIPLEDAVLAFAKSSRTIEPIRGGREAILQVLYDAYGEQAVVDEIARLHKELVE